LLGGEKEKMTETEKKGKRDKKKNDRKTWIVIARVILATVFSLGAVFYATQISSSWANLVITIVLTILAILATTLIVVSYRENRVFDRLGTLVIRKRGLGLVLPGIYRYVTSVPPAQMQASIPLFPGMEEKQAWIDAAIGGSLNFTDPRLWYMFTSDDAIGNTFQKVIDPLERLREEGEHATRSVINATPIDEIVPSTASKKDVKKELQNFLFDAVKNSRGMEDFLKHIDKDIELVSVTLVDYNLHPDVMKKRKERFDSIIDVEIAEQLSEADKRKIGNALAKIKKALVEGGFPEKKAHHAAIEIFRDKQAGPNLQRITWTSEGGEKKEFFSKEGIAEIAAAVKEIMGIQERAGGAGEEKRERKKDSEGESWFK